MRPRYLYVNSTVYAIGSDGSLWKWNNGWSYAGNDIAALTGGSSGSGSTTPTPSPNGTRGTQVVDSTGGVWTFNGTQTLRNGVWMGQGDASEYLYVNSTVYAIASDGVLCGSGAVLGLTLAPILPLSRAVRRAAVRRAVVRRAAVRPAAVRPAAVRPAAVRPAVVRPAVVRRLQRPARTAPAASRSSMRQARCGRSTARRHCAMVSG